MEEGLGLPFSSFPSPLALLSFLKRDDWGRVRGEKETKKKTKMVDSQNPSIVLENFGV